MSKPEVHVRLPELKRAFKEHGKIADEADKDSHHLLRFYANECGLKAMFMQENHLIDTSEFESKVPGIKYGYGHDLRRWMAEIKVPAFVIKDKDDPKDPLINAHEKLRYGRNLRKDQESMLKTIQSLLKKHL